MNAHPRNLAENLPEVTDLAAPLRDIWYFLCPAADVRPGKQKRMMVLGEPVVVGRTAAGKAFALRDVCAHRAAPLSAGRQVDVNGRPCVECPYHGWRFDTDNGACRQVPALSDTETASFEKISVPAYPLHEAQGLLWLFAPQNVKRMPADIPAPPSLPDGVPGDRPKMVIRVQTEGPYDEAVIGLVDPAHTPYVHQQWFWRRPDGAEEKVKDYEPSTLGFRMMPHVPASNGRAYKLIGGAATTEIAFRLPGLRFELIKNEKYTILGLTGITPTAEGRSNITQMFFWDMPLLSLLRPFAYPLARRFLGQDGRILSLQNANLALGHQKALYVGNADKLAQWYHLVKREYRASGASGFTNPVKPAQLKWRT